MLSLLPLIAFLPQFSYAYCSNRNPSFLSPPVLSEVPPNMLRVSWENIVKNTECVDNFLVKYWEKSNPVDFKMTSSPFIGAVAAFMDIEVSPGQEYTVQVIAIEDKGLLGIDYNESPKLDFQTSITMNGATTSRNNTNNMTGTFKCHILLIYFYIKNNDILAIDYIIQIDLPILLSCFSQRLRVGTLH